MIWTCAVGWLLILRLRSGGHDRGGGDVAWHHIEWVFLRTAHSLHGGLGFECSRRTTRLSDAQGARPRQTSIHGRRVVKSISTAGEGRCGYLAARQRCAGGEPLVAHGCGKSERRHPVRCSARGERDERLCVARAPLQHLRAERSESMLERRTLSLKTLPVCQNTTRRRSNPSPHSHQRAASHCAGTRSGVGRGEPPGSRHSHSKPRARAEAGAQGGTPLTSMC